MTAADFAIADLADSEAEFRERVRSLEADVAVYRQLALTAIQGVHDITRDRDRLRAQHHQLLDEYRRLRAQQREAMAA